jgi:hypothetical protein
MEEILRSFAGKNIDVSTGTSVAFRGEVVEVSSGVLYLRPEDEKHIIHIAVDRVVSFHETADHHSRPGFVSRQS